MSEDPAESEDRLIDEFIRRLNEVPGYTDQFLLTLELNKIEAVHQKQGEPMIFLKRLDNLGIVTSFELNRTYVGRRRFPKPKTNFDKEKRELAQGFDEEMHSKLSAMLPCGQIEQALLDGIRTAVSEEEFMSTPPVMIKTFDERGFPETYRLNVEIQTE